MKKNIQPYLLLIYTFVYMNTGEQLIEKFYTCFNRLDYIGMQQCYHTDIEFSDPVFMQLKGKRAKAMWHMLCAASKELSVKVTAISAGENAGSCNWDAWYLFSRTGRKVHNEVTARFIFKDGKIIQHHDHFNFWRWSVMALGAPGLLMGWSPLIKNKVCQTANDNLEKFIEKNSEYK